MTTPHLDNVSTHHKDQALTVLMHHLSMTDSLWMESTGRGMTESELVDVIAVLLQEAETAEGRAANLHPGGPYEYQTGLSMGYRNSVSLLLGTPLDKLPSLSMGT
jgi:hypothetical protein